MENTFTPLVYRMSVFNMGKVIAESNNECLKSELRIVKYARL